MEDGFARRSTMHLIVLALGLISCQGTPARSAGPATSSASVTTVVSSPPQDPPLCPALAEQPARVAVTPKLQRLPTGFILGVDIAADGRLAIVSDGDAVQIWDSSSLTLQRTLPAPALFSGSGRWATAAWDDRGSALRVFAADRTITIGEDGTPREKAHKLNHPTGHAMGDLSEVAQNTTGSLAARYLAMGGSKPVVAVWPGGEPSAKPTVVSVPDEPSDIELAPRAPLLIVSSRKLPADDDDDSDAPAPMRTHYYVVDTTRPAEAPKRFFSHDGQGAIIAVSGDGSLVAATQLEGVAQIVETATGKVRATIRPPYAASRTWADGVTGTGSFTHSGERLVVAYRDNLASYETTTGRLIAATGARALQRTEVVYAGSNALVTMGNKGASVWSLPEGSVADWLSLPGEIVIDPYANGDLLAATWGFSAKCGRVGTAITLRRVAPRAADDAPLVSRLEPATAPKWPLAAGESTSFCTSGLPLTARADAGKLVLKGAGKAPSVLDLTSGKTIELPGAQDSFSFQMSADGAWADVETNHSLAIVDAASGKEAVPRLMAALAPVRAGTKRRLLNWSIAPDHSSVAVLHDDADATFIPPNGKAAASHRFASAPMLVRYATPTRAIVTLEDGTFIVFDDWKIRHEKRTASGGFESIAVAPDGKSAAAIGKDQLTYVWDLDTGAVRAMLIDFNDQEYIALTPNGAYAGTAEVAQRLGWAFESPSELFGFELFASALERPEVVKKRLAGDTADLPAGLVRPPALAQVAPPRRAADGRSVTLSLEASSSSRVDAIRVFVEGRPAAVQAVCKRAEKVEITAALLPGTNHVAAVAFDAAGYSSRPIVTQIEGPGTDARPDVWIVAMGISSYPLLGPDLQLQAADDDARSMAALFEGFARPTGPFAKAHARVLIDAAVTPAAVVEALRASEQMKENDLLIVFLSGHGDKPSEGEDTMLLTSSSDGTSESLRKTGIGWGLVGAAIKKAKGRTVVLMDACHAGHVTRAIVPPNEALARSLEREHRAGAFVFAASKGRQPSYEANTKKGVKRTKLNAAAVSGDQAQGLFTGAFIEGARSAATDRNGDGSIQLSELVDEVRGRVQRATGGAQVPWVVNRSLFGDFAIAKLAP